MDTPNTATAIPTATKDHSPRRPRAPQRMYPWALGCTGATALSGTEMEVVKQALLILERKVLKRTVTFDSPLATRQWLALHYGMLQYEVFGLLLLDNRHHLIAHEQPFRGTLDGASVHPREILKLVLEHNAAAVIAIHNHPSFCGEPSQADELITRRIRESLALIDARLLDHCIVSGDSITSFAERGLI